MTRNLRLLASSTGLVGLVCLLMAAPTAAQLPPNASSQELDQHAEALYNEGKLEEAVATARLALQAAKTTAERGQSLGRLGVMLHTAGQMAEGENYLRESLRIREAEFGGDSLEYAEAAHDLAVFARDTGRRDEALKLAEQAVAIRRRLPPSDTRLPQALDTYGSVLSIAGDYAAAIPLFEEAMAMQEAIPAASRAQAEYGVLGVNLAATYQRVGGYERAEATLIKAREALRISPGTGHVAYIASTVTLATLKADLAQYAESESLFDEAIRLLAEQYPAHPFYPAALNNRGVMYRNLGNLALAEKDLTLSVQLKTAIFGAANVSTATTLANLGQLVYRRDRIAGERLLREAATTLAAGNAPPPFEQVNVLLGLARAERDRDALSDAALTLQQALGVVDRGLGMNHPLRAAAIREIGLTREARGDVAGAEAELTGALRVAEAAHGPDNPNLLPIVRALARVKEERGDAAAALAIHRRGFDIEDQFLNDVFAIGSEAFKEAVLSSLVDPVNALIGFQSRNGAQLPEARALAFEAATRRKGRVLEHVRQRREWLRGSPSPATGPILDELDAMTRCRTSLMLALGDRTIMPSMVGACSLEGTAVAGRYERLLSDLRARWTDILAADATRAIDVLEGQEQVLETALGRARGPLEGSLAPSTLESIAAGLQPDEALVELSAYVDDWPQSGNKAPGVRKYGAFVLDRERHLSWVDIGEAAPIELAAGDLLKAANDWTVSRRNHELRSSRALEATASEALEEISRRVWTPLEPAIAARANVMRLRVAPDSALNLVPFEAMELRTGGTLIERYSISYLPAGRDLLRVQPDASKDPPVIVVSAGFTRTAPARAEFPPLPGAAAEARQLAELLRAQIMTGPAASEQGVKALHSPFILHLVGHGRVGEDACLTPGCGARPGSKASAMALSAIVFEEAYGPVRGSREDGLLTAVELQDVDLRGTTMLVLSQCRMASGLPSVGEGIYGMRRAAAIAGVRTFVAPLWNVEDRVQRKLMTAFYRGLVAGRDRATALRDAKLSIKSAAATRSFLYWAPVILSGESAALESAGIP